MQILPDCIPCFYKQGRIITKMLQIGTPRELELFRGISRIIAENLDGSITPAALATDVHAFINDFLGVKDPFEKVKRFSNESMMRYLGEFERTINGAKDPFKMAVVISIIGNLIDYSLFENISFETIKDAISSFKPAIFEFDEFEKDLAKGEKILFLLDNAGEIVTDRLLIQQLIGKGKKIIVAVKERPILNDATRHDAETAGLHTMSRVIEIGKSDVGTIYPSENIVFNKAFKTADLIISKGQANFETLYDVDAPIYFMFVVKCQAVGSFLKVADRSPILMKRHT